MDSLKTYLLKGVNVIGINSYGVFVRNESFVVSRRQGFSKRLQAWRYS